MSGPLRGRPVALVTGAAGLLGRALDERLRADGFDVLGLDVRGDVDIVADLARDLPPDPRFAEVDVVVANAAILDSVAAAHAVEFAEFQRVVEVNLNGAFRVIQACLPGMRARGHGRIIAIASAAAVLGLNLQISYAASKAGLLGLVKTLAIEGGPYGITANAVLPGLFGPEAGPLPAGLGNLVAAGRTASAAEIAHVVAFLAGEHAAYITGQQLGVDGGLGLSPTSLHAPEPAPGSSA
ncbi:3-oxoacyl-ACP reductase FabG [Pseudonocardia ailaonensis]|uniref:3-oxoacyl-ACP reductase FabG n=1 Tax=Pseudonocardia ailaonensis TaxID=367279 RepID=A0ABN2MIM3_9PSEU